jgi:hypothetical protein
MNSQTIAAVVATITGLAVAAYAFSYVSFGDTYKSESQVVKTEVLSRTWLEFGVTRSPVT